MAGAPPEFHKTQARQKPGHVADDQQAECLRHCVASIRQAPQDVPAEREGRQGHRLQRQIPDDDGVPAADAVPVEDRAPGSPSLLHAPLGVGQHEQIAAGLDRPDGGNIAGQLRAEFLLDFSSGIGCGLLEDEHLRVIVDGERFLGVVVVQLKAKEARARG